MHKRILLVEPAYKTKYPPLGLMKIATYHKMKGDEVSFVKGRKKDIQFQYWDRVYITTLFTWTWDETVKTINFYRNSVFNFANKCYVGGILASLMPDELYNATGIQPIEGLLDNPQKIQQDDDIVIDSLAPDYSILGQVENANFKYANTDAYLGYTTRGCVWSCEFCAVKIFEPKYIPYVDMKKPVASIIKESGERPNLVLMDNNVLASNKFDQIIDDIKAMGFVKGARFGATRKKRIVDFNQGLDARFLTEDKMKRLTEIPLEPMRIAFDSLEYKDTYVKAIKLAHKYGQKDMSNYILYNFKDTPCDFYERLRINVDLNEEFKKDDIKTIIYSFPMRFIPLDAKKRATDTGNKFWNRRYLRGIQAIINVMKGPVMPGQLYFMQAFGRNIDEFIAILLMPDEFIQQRLVDNWKTADSYENRLAPYVREWMNIYRALNSEERTDLITILEHNDLNLIGQAYHSRDGRIQKLLRFHLEAEAIVAQYKENKS